MIPVVVSRKGRHLVYGAPVTWQSLNLMRSHYPKVLRVLNSRPGREWFCDVCFDLGKNTLEAYEASLVAEELKGAETYKEHRAFYARDGYPLHSPSPYRLWFAFRLPEVRVNYPVMGNRIDGHSLLR
jgi:hypothetical protein